MKKALVLLLLVLMTVGLCGCGKTAISCDTFRENMQSMDLQYYTYEEDFDGVNVLDYVVGGTEEEDPIVWFYEMANDDLAKSAFASVVSDWKSESGVKTSSNVTTPSYDFFSQKTSTDVFMAARVGSTFMYGGASVQNEDALKAIFDAMGYR